MAQSDDLTPKQTRAIMALLEAPSITRACELAGVGRRTLHRWLLQPEFTTALRAAETQTLSEAARGLLADLLANHQTIRAIRDDLTQPAPVRLRAAVELDAAALRWIQTADLSERLSELERAVYDAKQPA